MSRGRAVKASAVMCSPSSSSTTRMPASASSFATTAPPAPEPITHTSARTTRSPVMRGAVDDPRRPRCQGEGAAQRDRRRRLAAARTSRPRRTRSPAS